MRSAPDLNAETYPFDVVQQLLYQAAFFNLYSNTAGCQPVELPDGAIAGFHVSETLCRFSIAMAPPSARTGLRASNRVGEPIARFEHRWMFIPDRFAARPGVDPPACPFDPNVAQRFVMLDGRFTLDGGADGFRGFGTGRTAPSPAGRGDEVLISAIGTMTEGFGRFSGREGTYTYCGALSRDGFRGSLLLRVPDPEQVFTTDALAAAATAGPVPEPDVTYLLLAGQKRSRRTLTTYIFGDNDRIIGFDVEPQLRLMHIDCGAAADGTIQCASSIGQVIGTLASRVTIDLLNPGAPGSDAAPIPFSSYNRYTITSADGCVLGTFDADGAEGRTFNMLLPAAPGQRALRFGAFGRLMNGQGRFAGIAGHLTDNSAVGVAPHALATTYLLRLFDREGAYRIGPR